MQSNSVQAGDIALIPFPYSDLTTQKKRPVLVLSHADARGDFICLAITSKQTLHNALLLNADDCTPALPKTSWIRLDKIFTLNSAQVIQIFGEISPSKFEKLPNQFCQTLFPL